jgi:N utilization substance protein A
VVDLGRGEAILKRNELIPREIFRVGDTIKAYIYSVRSGGDGPTVLLSRTHPQFMAKLFEQEVPEIYDGTINIKSVARDPGSRGKICVYTDDVSLDPVGSCVGVRGSRVQAIVNELRGEKIDIIQWKDDFASLVVSSLTPAEITKVVLDEDKNRVEVVVPQESLSQAIGRSGQNVRLASILLGMDIDIITEEQDSEKRAEELKNYIAIFKNQLDVDDVIAGLLATEGFFSVEEIVEAGMEELKSIDGFNETIASEILTRAENYINQQEQKLITKQQELGFDDSLFETGLDANEIILLAENGIKNLEELADLASDELLEIVGENTLSSDEADTLIMAARSLFIDFGDTNNDGDDNEDSVQTTQITDQEEK